MPYTGCKSYVHVPDATYTNPKMLQRVSIHTYLQYFFTGLFVQPVNFILYFIYFFYCFLLCQISCNKKNNLTSTRNQAKNIVITTARLTIIVTATAYKRVSTLYLQYLGISEPLPKYCIHHCCWQQLTGLAEIIHSSTSRSGLMICNLRLISHDYQCVTQEILMQLERSILV